MTKIYRDSVNKLNISTGIKQLMEASAYQEVYNEKTNSQFTCNNPGSIRKYKGGNICSTNKSYASFPDIDTGVSAQYSRTYGIALGSNYANSNYPKGPNTTLFEFWTIYAPKSDGNDDTFYTNIVIDYLSLVFGLKSINGKPITYQTTLGEFNSVK